MAFSPTQSGNMFPGRSVFFPGLIAGTGSVTGTSGVFIPFTALESYNVGNSGEVGELVYSIVDKFATGLNNLSGVPTATDDLPARFNVSRQTSLTSDNTATKTFSLSFDLNVSSARYDLREET
jgi:hypothetical protein